MGKGQDRRRSAVHQEYGHRPRACASASQNSLLGACRRCDQGRHRQLEKQEGHRCPGGRKGFALKKGLALNCKCRRRSIPRPSSANWVQPKLFMTTEVANPAVPAVHVSERAARKILALLAKDGVSPQQGGLRVGVQGGGCSGLSYAMRLDTQARDRDKVFEEHGARLFVDPKSFLYLNGTTLEYEETLMREGFVFQNPNAARNCGCGSSFTA